MPCDYSKMELKDVVKKKIKKNIITARVDIKTKNYIKQNKINVRKLIERGVDELRRK